MADIVANLGSRGTARSSSRRPMSLLARRRARWGLLFMAPWFIGFLAFQFLPIAATVFLSFTNYSATKEFNFENIQMVGFDNYARLASDPYLLQSVWVTVKFALIAIPLGLVVPLCFALLVNSSHLIG